MRQTAIASALALSILAAGACLPAQARQAQPQIGARPGTQAASPTASQTGPQAGPQLSAGAGAPTQQQAQKAQQSRSEAEAYLQQEEAAATNRQTQNTDRANRAGSVADEASGASAGGSTRVGVPASGAAAVSGDAGPSYGPVLNPRQPQATDPARRNPAEVQDETDSGANPAAQSKPKRGNSPQAARHPAWQPGADPMAPRPLRQDRATASNPEPVPAPSAAPQPLLPSSTVVAGCQGGSCTDSAGARINGIGSTGVGSSGAAGVSSAGRLCNRTGVTVQCF